MKLFHKNHIKFNDMIFHSDSFVVLKANLIWIACIIFIGCFDPPQKSVAEKPGFYGISSRWNRSVEDVDAEVGHSFFVSGPRASCVPGQWHAAANIISGALPPGLK